MSKRPHSVRSAGVEYEAALGRDERRRRGIVYSPPHVVRFVLDLAGYDSRHSIENKRVVDPACGTGAFLAECVKRIASRLRRIGTPLEGSDGQERLLSAVEHSIFGIDSDERACEIARQSLRQAVIAESHGPNITPDRLKENVYVSDFLNPSTLSLFAEPLKTRFDFIVGNPPYVSATKISKDRKGQLRKRFESAEGRIELYTLFFERSSEIIASGGTLAFITPDKFLSSDSAKALRRLLLRRLSLARVARFNSHRVFSNADTVTCVTVFRREQDSKRVELLSAEVSSAKAFRVVVKSRDRIEAPSKNGAPWQLLDPTLAKLAAKIVDGHQPLSNLVARISAGIATGSDSIFVLTSREASTLEKDLLRPALRGKDIKRSGINDPGLRIIVPYETNSLGNTKLIDLRAFPKTFRYLSQHRDVLEDRHCVREWGKQWFELHDPWTFDVSTTAKVLCPDLADENRFVLDHGRFCPLHSAYYLLPKRTIAPTLLVAVLNSRPVEFVARLLAPIAKDGFSRYMRQSMAFLPVPRFDNSDVDAIEHADPASRDAVFAKIFQLSDSELTVIDRYLERRKQWVP